MGFEQAESPLIVPEPDKVEAEFKNGLLSVRIAQPPKVDNARRIAVKAGGEAKAESETAGSEDSRSCRSTHMITHDRDAAVRAVPNGRPSR